MKKFEMCILINFPLLPFCVFTDYVIHLHIMLQATPYDAPFSTTVF